MNLELEISKIRNIQEAKMTLPLQKGMYALVGENGCGKSTLMLIMSLLVKTSSAHMITSIDIQEDSTIVLKTDAGNDIWRYKNGKLTTGKYKTHKSFHKRSKTFGVKSHSTLVVSTHWPGFYEGSIFYGSRFYNFEAVDDFLQQDNCRDSLIEADIFVSEMLGYILHNNKAYYKNLFRIKNRATAEQNGLKGVPYFAEYNNQLVSQFKMSSGECLLLSLIDFISTLIIHGTHYKKFLLLIDEVELALHPGAIDRLISFLSKIIDDSDKRIVVYFSSHSAELIQKISPRNIYLIENDDGILTTVNPCYPNYAIRNLYIPNGFDFLLLVEDELAKVIVDNVIRENNLATSKLCCVLPAGGCTQMLKLHRDLVTYNTLGAGKRIISIVVIPFTQPADVATARANLSSKLP